MHTIESSFTQHMNNIYTATLKNNEQQHYTILAISIGFHLDNPDEMIQAHSLNEKINPILEAYQIGIDEAYPKKKSELIIFGKNTVTDSKAISENVSINIGSIKKSINVYPKRHWQMTKGKAKIITTGELKSVDICFQNAYGGQDYQKNQLGKGHLLLSQEGKLDNKKDPVMLPQLELTGNRVASPYNKKIPVATFTPIPMQWHDRAKYFGKINPETHPAMPKNQDSRFFQTVALDQQQAGPFKPGESFAISGMSAKPITGTLPKLQVRLFSNESEDGRKIGQFKEQKTRLDTVVLFPNQNIGVMTYRAEIPTNTFDGKEVKTYLIAVDKADLTMQRSKGHYRKALENRLGEDRAHYGLKQGDLLPKGYMKKEIAKAPSPDVAGVGATGKPQVTSKTMALSENSKQSAASNASSSKSDGIGFGNSSKSLLGTSLPTYTVPVLGAGAGIAAIQPIAANKDTDSALANESGLDNPEPKRISKI